MKVAIDIISDFLLENEMTVYIVIFDKAAYRISEKLFFDIVEYIDDNYVDEHIDYMRDRVFIAGSKPPRRAARRDTDAPFSELYCDFILDEDDLMKIQVDLVFWEKNEEWSASFRKGIYFCF